MTDKEEKTARAKSLLAQIANDIGKAGRSDSRSYRETTLTIAMHKCSNVLAISADQSFGPHYWEQVIARAFELSGQIAAVHESTPRGVNHGCGYQVAEL